MFLPRDRVHIRPCDLCGGGGVDQMRVRRKEPAGVSVADVFGEFGGVGVGEFKEEEGDVFAGCWGGGGGAEAEEAGGEGGGLAEGEGAVAGLC